jgi:death-on-curing protein
MDGNKRTGVAAALSFLKGNGVFIPASTDRFYQAMIAVAEKRMDKAQLAALFREVAACK